MRRVALLCAAATIAVSALAAASPANAFPFKLIRWNDSGFCQIWDDGIPTAPWPYNYTIVSEPMATFNDAFVYKTGMLRAGACAF